MDDDFDTFDNFNEEDDITCENKNVIIRIDKRNARKSISYIEDWNLNFDDLKDHLKKLKSKLGCNGSIKKKIVDEKEVIIFQLQGDKRRELINYLVDNGVDNNKITVIG